MSTLSSFFKGSETHMGVFYPRGYLIAVFPNLKAAQSAEKLLFEAAFLPEDVAAVSGEELTAEHTRNHGIGALVMQQLSRVFQTEEAYTDHDLELAVRGAAFLMVYCPSEILKGKAWQILQPTDPLMARHYAFAGIEHLVGEA